MRGILCTAVRFFISMASEGGLMALMARAYPRFGEGVLGSWKWMLQYMRWISCMASMWLSSRMRRRYHGPLGGHLALQLASPWKACLKVSIWLWNDGPSMSYRGLAAKTFLGYVLHAKALRMLEDASSLGPGL